MNKTATNYEKLKKEVVDQHNLVRTNPKSYVPILEKHIKLFTGNIINKPGAEYGVETQEGANAYKECIEFLKKQKAVGAMAFDTSLSKACQDHADDIGPDGTCDHTGSDGSSVDDRITRYLEWDVTVCENIDFGATTGEEIIISLIVDDGIPDRGHRKNIFNPKLTYLGVGAAVHAEYGICTIIDYVGGIVSYNEKKGGTKAAINTKVVTGATKIKNVDVKDTEEAGIAIEAMKDAIKNREKSKTVATKQPEKDLSSQLKKKLSLNQGKRLVADNPFINDPDAPEGAINCEIKIVTKKAGGKTTKKTIKTYTMEDGSENICEIEEIEG